MGFQYFISAKNGLIVASLQGGLDDKDGPALKRCLDEVTGHNPSGIVINLAGLSALPPSAYREFAAFSRALKATNKAVLMASLHSEALKNLLNAGLVSKADMREDLTEAVKEMAGKIMDSKAA